MLSSLSYSGRHDTTRRFRNRTLSGMDTNSGAAAALLAGRAGSSLGHHSDPLGTSALGGGLHQRPSSATGLRPITPSSYGGGAGGGAGDKENGQNFIDFNPAGEKDALISQIESG